jgi:3-oxoacyl-[acyl-carrier protein] reductase
MAARPGWTTGHKADVPQVLRTAMQNAQVGCAFVTGGASGIGLAIAHRLFNEGWNVVVGDMNVELGGKLVGTGIHFQPVDIRERDQVDEAIRWIEERVGTLRLLVNNAGIQRRGPTEDISAADWNAVIDVNLNGTFNCLQATAQSMLRQGSGTIVNIASNAAERGVPGRAPYSASKAAIIALTRTAAVEWASRGIRVNAVAPGYVETAMVRAGIDAGDLDEAQIVSRIPMQRMATPDEIAGVVSFLASPEASYITGQTIFVDGGFLANYGVDIPRA